MLVELHEVHLVECEAGQFPSRATAGTANAHDRGVTPGRAHRTQICHRLQPQAHKRSSATTKQAAPHRFAGSSCRL